MSTEIYNGGACGGPQEDALERHLQWVMCDIVRPQLGEMVETLEQCAEALDEHNSSEYRLPISSYNSEAVKGTITRRGFSVVDLRLEVKMVKFNGGRPAKYRLVRPLLVRQLLDCYDCIGNAKSGLQKLVDNKGLEGRVFTKYLEQVVNGIRVGITSLQEPNEGYTFPRLRIPNEAMEPALPNELALDLNLSNNELSIDVYALKVVTQEPWNIIVDRKRGVSFVDAIRERVSRERGVPVTQIIREEYLKASQGGALQGGVLGALFGTSEASVLSNFNHYIDKCLTVEDCAGRGPVVVRIDDVRSVVTNDPVVLSLSIKLRSLEKALCAILTNLRPE